MVEKYPRALACGDSGISIEFGDCIDERLNAQVLALDAALARSELVGVIETVPTYRALLLHYDPVLTTYHALAAEALKLVSDGAAGFHKGRVVNIPVCYDDELGLDLAAVAKAVGLPPEEVIHRHVANEYRVYMLGFQPGFAYLGGLDTTLSLPRRSTPRFGARAGTISIASGQCAVHAVDGPSGWHWIGHTPLRTFINGEQPYFALEPGDRVHFNAIGIREWRELCRAATADEAKFEGSN